MSKYFCCRKKWKQFSLVEYLNYDIIIRVKIRKKLMSAGKGVAKPTVVCPFKRLMKI